MVFHRPRLDAVCAFLCQPEAHGDALHRPPTRASRDTGCMVHLRQSLVCADAHRITHGGTISARSSPVVVERFCSSVCEPRFCFFPGGTLHTHRSLDRPDQSLNILFGTTKPTHYRRPLFRHYLLVDYCTEPRVGLLPQISRARTTDATTRD